jgi:hypothetical protein
LILNLLLIHQSLISHLLLLLLLLLQLVVGVGVVQQHPQLELLHWLGIPIVVGRQGLESLWVLANWLEEVRYRPG